MAATPATGPTMEAQRVQPTGSNPGSAPTPGPSTKGRNVQKAGINTPVLSTRALQELMKRNHRNFVSVRVDQEVVFRVPRPLAVRFSAVWSRLLQDITCNVVTLDFPLDPPAPQGPASDNLVPPPPPAPSAAPPVPQSGPTAGRNPAASSLVPPPPPPPSGKTALKFIIQWMEAGGWEPRGVQAVPYPRGYRPGLEKILAIASKLEISDLVSRVKRDLGRLPPKKCRTCKKPDHPGRECQSCFHCGDYDHRVRECPVRYREFLEREARRARKAEREIAHQRYLEREERRKKAQEKRGIATGELGVNHAGNTIPVHGRGKLTLGRTASSPP